MIAKSLEGGMCTYNCNTACTYVCILHMYIIHYHIYRAIVEMNE